MFNINGDNWRIVLVSPNHPKIQRSDGTFALGVCDNASRTIYIDNELNEFYLKKVLCHEITHAAMFSYGIILTLQQEELLADLLASYG